MANKRENKYFYNLHILQQLRPSNLLNVSIPWWRCHHVCWRWGGCSADKYFSMTDTITSASNRSIGEVVQSRRRPLLGPSPGWKHLLALSQLRRFHPGEDPSRGLLRDCTTGTTSPINRFAALVIVAVMEKYLSAEHPRIIGWGIRFKLQMLCWSSSKMEASDWLKFVCYKYLAATTTLFKRNWKKI